jgi:hypothetical protein
VIQAAVALLAGLLHRFDAATVLAAELVLLVAGSVALARRRAVWREIVADARRAAGQTSTLERMVVLALLLMGATELWRVAAIPVIDWDSWAFHMPAMARWLQAGEFVRLEQYALRPRAAYPYTWEAVCALFLMPFGEDAFVALPSLAAWALLAVATFTAARELSAARPHALAAGAFVASMPHLVVQVNSLHVDMPFAAFSMAALSFALAFQRRRAASDLALCAAALGMLCGVRSTGPLYVAAVVALLLGLRRWGDRPATPGARSPAPRPLIVLCLVSCVFIGSFWWVKNFAEYGSPLGPVALTQAGLSADTFEKPAWKIAFSAVAFRFTWLEPSSWMVLAARAWSEIGLPLPVMLAQLALMPMAWRSDRPRTRRAAILAAILVLATAALFVFSPASGVSGIQLRLGFAGFATLAIAGAVAATGARVPAWIAAVLAIAAAVEVSGHSRVFQLAAASLIPLALVHRRPSRPAVTRALAVCLCAAVILFTLVARVRRVQKRAAIYGPGFAYIEQNIGEDEPVGYLLSDRSYYFYGTQLRRRVHYVPLSDGGPTAAWFEALRAKGIRAVIVGPYEGGDDGIRRTVAGLRAPHGELVAVFGQGRPGEITVYRWSEPQMNTGTHG